MLIWLLTSFDLDYGDHHVAARRALAWMLLSIGESVKLTALPKAQFRFIEAMATCVRFATPSLRIMQRRCTLTVASDKPS